MSSQRLKKISIFSINYDKKANSIKKENFLIFLAFQLMRKKNDMQISFQLLVMVKNKGIRQKKMKI